jgi:hypothetical protein
MKLKSFYPVLYIVLLAYYFTSCQGTNQTVELPSLITQPVTSVTVSTAVSGGTIISVGSGTVLEKGICWSTEPQPTVDDEVTMEGPGNDPFTSLMRNLKGNADYYVRSYAKTETTIGYGDQMAFKTGICSPPDSTFRVCDEAYIISYPGTACCISGSNQVNPDDSSTYRYVSNIANANITWTVLHGSITLVSTSTSGENVSIATFEFGSDFTSGCISVTGEEDGGGSLCSDFVSLVSQ